MAGTGNPTARRRELGTLLRAQRLARGLTVDEVAAHVLVSPSKISRVETGQRGATARDIRDLAALYELSDQDRQLLTDLAAEGKQRAWWQPFNLTYSAYIDLEADAVSIRDFNLAIVPGLLQTESYARAILKAAKPQRSEEGVRQYVEARQERQTRVLQGEGRSPSFTAIVDEAVLRRTVGGPEVMREQLRALRESAKLRNVNLRVVSFRAGALPVGTNKFIILGFDRRAMPDLVYLESLTEERILDHEREVQEYVNAFTMLSEMAAPETETLEFIASAERDYGPS